jgi:hypothetical protein
MATSPVKSKALAAAIFELILRKLVLGVSEEIKFLIGAFIKRHLFL